MAEGHDGRLLINRLKEFLPAGSRVLEIGSGPGKDWNLLKDVYRVIGSDNSKAFLDHLRATFPVGEFLELEAETLLTGEQFDGIFSNKVLHHLEDEALVNSIKRQFELLHPGGIVCHSFWYGQDSEFYNNMFVNYHSDEGIRILFGDYFHHKLFHYYREFEEADSFLYIGQKK